MAFLHLLRMSMFPLALLLAGCGASADVDDTAIAPGDGTIDADFRNEVAARQHEEANVVRWAEPDLDTDESLSFQDPDVSTERSDVDEAGGGDEAGNPPSEDSLEPAQRE